MFAGRRMQGACAGGLLFLFASSGCSLEDALGVDEGGDGTMGGSTTEVSPGGSSSGLVDEGSTTSSGSSDSGPPVIACNGRAVRVAAFNVETVGSPGSVEFDALVAILGRIDAEIVCLEEVQHWETMSLFSLAGEAGYEVIQARESPAIGGDHTNACMSRAGLGLVGTFTASDLSSDAQANDVGRDILVVQVELGNEVESCRLGVVALHLKSGQDDLDWFRRQIEVERVAQAVALYREQYPGEPMVIMGDLNENDDDPALGTVLTGEPEGLPPTYQLGQDIELPLTYQPFDRFEGLGFVEVPATQEGSTRDQTWNDAVRLDYVYHAGSELQAAEVYNACRDDGGGLPKAGAPLACAVSDEASDHFPVVADLVLP